LPFYLRGSWLALSRTLPVPEKIFEWNPNVGFPGRILSGGKQWQQQKKQQKSSSHDAAEIIMLMGINETKSRDEILGAGWNAEFRFANLRAQS